ncbi:asparagine synthase (glutamine-hydrolyzing) [Ferruginibacter albus]|uniref:asparagine synthase (glutamine-hydrolyzing) n=1 Tax=Ferruginibacter albus TaxID=2875540 RepID=UPI001CC4F7B3|nr:asparagine synthase (glutamine-hydrolyzing) [Ferruginibacter albus]UAY52229.1 asparagine synthase (glutamine-hydrolyzing) [Ferruginibacter albus]
MCGIAGYISLNNTISTEQLKQAAGTLQHRGPDAEGFYFSPDHKIGFAHRRLSVIDLSHAADQPMFSKSGRYCIIYNGEVYNFKELKESLSCKGHSLKTSSDTEVIIELFEQHGTKIFEWLNGMFAMAIYDTQQGVITLARDHVGIKPLFFYCYNDELIFGSELKVIRSIKEKKLTVNKEAVPYYLHLGYIPHPLTIYNNVHKFPSGSYWQIDCKNNFSAKDIQNIQTFWAPEKKITAATQTDEVTSKEKLKTLLVDSVQHQLISDVPVGVFLSGGIDSSLIAAIATKLIPDKVKTFSIAIDDGKFNESKYARAVAEQLGTEHNELQVQEKEVISLLDRFLSAYDEPYGDPSAFPTMVVSHFAKQQVTVALSGDGGDELFGGYGFYSWAKRLSNPLIPLLRWPIYGASLLMSHRFQRAGQMFAYKSKATLASHIFTTEQYYFSEQELDNLLNGIPYNFIDLNKIDSGARKLSAFEKQALWDLKSYLKDELLVKVDRASMQFSLETRVPLLDHKVVEFALNLDQQYKINSKGEMKYLLKEVLYDYLPAKLFDRPKWGFRIPLEKWMRKDLREMVETYTCEAIINKYGYVNYKVVADLKKQYFNGKDYLYNRIWLIMVLHWWLETNET